MYFMVISCVLFTITQSLDLLENSTLTTRSILTEVLPISRNATVGKENTTIIITTVFPALVINRTGVVLMHTFNTTTPRSTNVRLTLMGRNLDTIPEGDSQIENVNLGYNNIKSLPSYVFWNNSYSSVRKINLQQNRITNIHVGAFRGIRQVTQIDLSNNKISTIDPYTFKGNNRLEKLVLMNNQISFNRIQTFLLSYSINYLVLSNNKIDEIYELSFLGLPNLKTLILNGNNMLEIAPNSFKALSKLHYLSLANTGVYRLEESMFLRLPKIINLDRTPLSAKFEPPLKKIAGESIRNLLNILRFVVDDKIN